MKGMNQLIHNYSTEQEATAQVYDANVATDEVQRYYLLPIKCFLKMNNFNPEFQVHECIGSADAAAG